MAYQIFFSSSRIDSRTEVMSTNFCHQPVLWLWFLYCKMRSWSNKDEIASRSGTLNLSNTENFFIVIFFITYIFLFLVVELHLFTHVLLQKLHENRDSNLCHIISFIYHRSDILTELPSLQEANFLKVLLKFYVYSKIIFWKIK